MFNKEASRGNLSSDYAYIVLCIRAPRGAGTFSFLFFTKVALLAAGTDRR